MKNKDPLTKDKCANYALDWIGQVPGKRESRRIIGRYFMTEHDVLNKTVFPDEIAFGGWFVDLHTPGGLLAKSSEPSAAAGGHEDEYDTFSDYSAMSYCGPYGVPLRILMAKDIDNLMMAGRNVSVTHAALGTVRVMGTTALMGEAAGMAAALGLEKGHDFDQLVSEDITEIQQRLLANGCFLPNYRNNDAKDLARQAKISATSDAPIHGVAPETPGFHQGSRSGGTSRNTASSASKPAAASSSPPAADASIPSNSASPTTPAAADARSRTLPRRSHLGLPRGTGRAAGQGHAHRAARRGQLGLMAAWHRPSG